MSQLHGDALKNVIDVYIYSYCADINQRPKTITGKKESLYRIYKFLKGQEFTLVNSKLYFLHLAKINWSPSSINCEKKVVKTFCKYLLSENLITEDWGKTIKLAKLDKKSFEYVEPEIVEQVILAGTKPTPFIRRGLAGDNSRNKYIKQETRIALLFMLKTGRRVGEVLKMTGSDLRLYDKIPFYQIDSSRIKQRKELIEPIPVDMLKELQDRVNRKKLFDFTQHTANAVLKRGCDMLGIKTKLTCHSLRHIFASNQSKLGTPIQHVADLLGNTVETTAKVYTHHDLSDLARYLNSPKTTVRKGLSQQQVFDLVEQSVRSTGVELDDRVRLEIVKEENEKQMTISIKFQ